MSARAAVRATLLFGEDDPKVAAELARRQEHRQRARSWNSGAAIMAAAAKGTSWSRATGFTPDALTNSPWYHTLSAQQQRCATLSLSENPDRFLLQDVGQSLTRI